ncbi:MAG: delta-60 repeat domain-containing protein, partial [Verrucomicrobia bacterium]|nr:delta-60 repeat domain-containing protein [Verrucomicrobiota bacterium]
LARVLPTGTRDPGFSLTTGANDDVYAAAFAPFANLFLYDSWIAQGTNAGRTNVVDVGSRAGTITISFYNYVFSLTNTTVTNNLTVYFGPLVLPILNTNIVNTNAFGNAATITVPFGPVVGTNYQLRVVVDGGVTNTNSWSYSATISRGLPDEQQMIVAGAFTSLNGTNRNYVARLNPDGSLDPNFNGFFASGPDDVVRAVAVQPDGGVVIGGDFHTVNGLVQAGIARLSGFGYLDYTFNPGLGVDGIVTALALQADGKILVGGLFSAVDGTPRNNLARLNPDGSLDFTFDPPGSDQMVRTIVVQSDGNILVGGDFSTFNADSHLRLVRLDTNGVVDATFSAAANGTVFALAASLIQGNSSTGLMVTDSYLTHPNYVSTNVIPTGFTSAWTRMARRTR